MKPFLTPLALLLTLLAGNVECRAANTIELYPNIHTIGISVRFSTALPLGAVAETFIAREQNGSWGNYSQGLPLSRVSPYYYGGCVFYTAPATHYKVRVLITFQGNTIADITDSTRTRAEIATSVPNRTFFVSPAGTGVSQLRSNPGKLDQNLLNTLTAGDKVLLLEGRYYTGELQVTSSGTSSNPILFEGENDSVVIDGSFEAPIVWTRVTQDTAHVNYNMFYGNLGAINTNCVVNHTSRMYPYRNLLELSNFSVIRLIDGSGNTAGVFPIGEDGFFRDGRDPLANHFPWIGYNNRTYIKFADGSDTSGKQIHVSKQTQAFSIKDQSHIQFRKLRFTYFGAAKLNNRRCAIAGDNADYVLVDSCIFEFCDRGVVFIGNSDRNTIQHSRFHDDFAKLSYFAFKETGLDYQHLNTNYPNFFPYQNRNVEPGRIYFDRNFTGRGNIVRYNYISGGCDGITCPVTPGDSNTARHFDIYGNEFGEGSDDAFELDGNASNIRVWENTMHGAGNGISVASPCYGPVYIFRNVIYNLRKTVYQYVVNITTMVTDTIPGSPIKLNAAYCDIPGTVYFMHNTCVTGKDAHGLVLFQPQTNPSWSKVIARNNIFYNNSNHFSLWVRATDSIDLDYNLYYRPKGFLARQDRPAYKEFTSLAAVQAGILGNINLSGSFVEQNGIFADPVSGWVDADNFNFKLKSNSVAVDKGEIIPGLNDSFSGTFPDIGAFEYGTVNALHKAEKTSLLLFPVPADRYLVVRSYHAALQGADLQILDIHGRNVFTGKFTFPETKLAVGALPNGLYFLRCKSSTATTSALFQVQHR